MCCFRMFSCAVLAFCKCFTFAFSGLTQQSDSVTAARQEHSLKMTEIEIILI